MVVVQDELQNHCRSRETCSFGTPDAVVCKAARSASAVLAAVGPSVGIGARAGGWLTANQVHTIGDKTSANQATGYLSTAAACFDVKWFYPKTQLSWLARLDH